LAELPPAPRHLDDVDADWLSRALGAKVADLSVTPFGTGNIAATARMEITWADTSGDLPASLVAKVPVADPHRRRSAMAWRCYEIEAAFYATLAPGLQARLPHCYWAGFDPGTEGYAVLLEDLTGWRAGDDLAGGDAETAHAVLRELAPVHGAHWGDPSLADLPWLNRYPKGNRGTLSAAQTPALPRLLECGGAALSPESVGLIERFVANADGYESKYSGLGRTIVHGDVRSDNLLFGSDRVCLLDWQTLYLGAAVFDVAYHLAAALPLEARRTAEESLLRDYHARLVTLGVPLSWHECWTEYRRNAFALLITMLKGALDMDLSGRAAALFGQLAERAALHALDHDAEALLHA
jgi:hypothetical protein